MHRFRRKYNTNSSCFNKTTECDENILVQKAIKQYCIGNLSVTFTGRLVFNGRIPALFMYQNLIHSNIWGQFHEAPYQRFSLKQRKGDSLYNHTAWNFPAITYITFTQFILNIKRVNCILAF